MKIHVAVLWVATPLF